MLELVREYDVAKRFRKLKKSAPKSIVAVPFWGKGALTLLGIGGGQKSQIVCNLQSSACNPYVIEDLKNTQGVTVRSNPRLHAKIYATDKFAIIGSSNASSNGLAIEGQPESWIEANVISDDPAIVGSAFALFQEIWDSPETSKITNAALTEAKKLWDNRPKQQPRVTATSLLAACREQPELFEAVYLAVYDEGLGPKGSRKLKDFKKSQRCQRRSKSRPLGRSKNRPVCGVGIEHDAPRPPRRRWPGFRSRGGRGFQESGMISPVSGSTAAATSSGGRGSRRRLAFDCLSR